MKVNIFTGMGWVEFLTLAEDIPKEGDGRFDCDDKTAADSFASTAADPLGTVEDTEIEALTESFNDVAIGVEFVALFDADGEYVGLGPTDNELELKLGVKIACVEDGVTVITR